MYISVYMTLSTLLYFAKLYTQFVLYLPKFFFAEKQFYFMFSYPVAVLSTNTLRIFL